MVRTDFSRRGIPWVDLMLRHRGTSTELNLAWRHRVSAAVIRRCCSQRASTEAAHRRFFAGCARGSERAVLQAPLLQRRGPFEAAAGVLLHAVHHVTGAVAAPVGVVVHLLRRR